MFSVARSENYEKQAPVMLDKEPDPAHCLNHYTRSQTHTTAEGWVGYESLGRFLVRAALAGRGVGRLCITSADNPPSSTHRIQPCTKLGTIILYT